jgi:acyl-CoA thioester hydrolase
MGGILPQPSADAMTFTSQAKGPHLSPVLTVKPEWVDYNGHFNMAYYNVLFDEAAEEMFSGFGLGPAYVKEANCSYFTLEAHLTYLRELHAGDSVQVETIILDCDHKRVHYVQRMLHKDAGWLSCVSEVIVAHVDLQAKKTAHFPDHIYNRIKFAEKSHENLPRPQQVGHKIGIPKKS